MKVVSTAQMRELDRRTIEECRVPGEALMDRAGFGVARSVARLLELKGFEHAPVLLIAGRGNNGGDAFAAARHLREMQHNPSVWLAGSFNEINGDARAHLDKLKPLKIQIEEFSTKDEWDQMVEELDEFGGVNAPVIVDGVLGTGIKGPARGPAAGAIRYINASTNESLIVAIDIPSGLNSDTGLAEGDAVCADITVTMGLPKRGLIEPAAINHVGQVEIVSIGIPRALTDKLESDVELIAESDIRPLFPRRLRNAHKGNFGHVLLIGGADGYAGAIILAARAAVRSGVGLVTVLAPRGIAAAVAMAVPEAMVHGVLETESGSISERCWPVWRERLTQPKTAGAFTAVMAGVGLTRHAETGALVRRLIHESAVPLVLDADALNVFEGRGRELKDHRCPLIVTPHPRELGRLLDCSTEDVQMNRFTKARECAASLNAVAVLKGAGTLVAAIDRPLQINLTGNPGLAKGGSGDVLAGLLGGLLAQGLDPFDAARAAVFIHGKAGDDAAIEKTEPGLRAGDIIESLPYAFETLGLR